MHHIFDEAEKYVEREQSNFGHWVVIVGAAGYLFGRIAWSLWA